MTPHEMARAVGFGTNYGGANDQFGKQGHQLADAMDYQPEPHKNGTHTWSSIFALGRSGPAGFQWTMRPELANALEELRWVDPLHTP